MKRLIFTLLVVLTTSTFSHFGTANAQITYENSRRLNDGWLFLRGDIGNIWEAVRPIPTTGEPAELVPLWNQVTLPHCYNALDAVDPDVNYYEGPVWYRTRIAVENPYADGRTLLHFEGAGQRTEVWIYTTQVAEHVGGYDEWNVDITDAVAEFLASPDAARFEGRVPLSIRCDNTRDTETIPSDLSDFNIYGGIYRYLNLVYTPAVAISGLHTDASVDSKGKQGRVVITPEYERITDDANITLRVLDPAGKEVFRHASAAEKTHTIEFSLDKPALWSPSQPALYTAEMTLTSPSGTMQASERFGFRHFEFVEHGPFMLNGERLLLRGTHRHEDHAGVGAAMDEETIVREMEMIKSMGVNFIRLGHYQQSRIVLRDCDRLGILVWEEIPWCRGGLGGEQYKAQARRMLNNMITQHRNHPSVILWGMGNENDWPNDFQTFDREAVRAFMIELHNLSHELDPTRLTAIRRCDFCKDVVDVYSPSIWAGWYSSDSYKDYKRLTENAFNNVERFLHVEWGGDSHAGRHSEDPLAWQRNGGRAPAVGDWSESYVCDLIDWHLKEQLTMPWLTGTAYWPFKDFSTPLRPENPVPYVNQKGVVERDLTPKESFYVFQSYWVTEPMVHIYGHSWPVRWGGEGEARTVKVYSNCDEVELFVNGVSQGRRKRNPADFPAAGLRWDVTFKADENDVRAIGFSGREKVEDQIVLRYETRSWSIPAAIETTVTDNGDGTVFVDVQLVDSAGVPCLDSRAWIYFEKAGDGKLLDDLGTATGSRKVQAANGRARIKIEKQGGETVVAVRSEGLQTIFSTIIL